MTHKNMTQTVFSNPIYFLAFGFGSGLLPWMPGTFGTVAAIPFFLLLQPLPWQIYLIIVLITFVAGIWLCDRTEQKIGMADYSGIVWDEMVGYWATMFMAPPGWWWLVLGFLLFRLFDIWKPWPIRWVNDHIHQGVGIMLDDFLAAIISCSLLHVAILVASRY